MSSTILKKIHQQALEFERLLKRRDVPPKLDITPEQYRLIETTKMGILKYAEKFEGIKNNILIADVKVGYMYRYFKYVI